MGFYDTLVDGDKHCQTKIFSNTIKTYYVGDKPQREETFTIVFPDYEEAKFALIENGVFKKLTDDETEIYPPLIDKWGRLLEDLNDFVNPFQEEIEKIQSSEQMLKEAER